MFVRSRRYNRDLLALKDAIRVLEKKVQQLGCGHVDTRIETIGFNFWGEVCISCGYTVNCFQTEKEMLLRELTNREKEVESIKDRIKSTET